MSIEEAIKQKSFPNIFEKAVINLLYTGSHYHSINQKRLKPFGISPEQYNVLRILRGSAPRPMSILDISSRMLEKNSNATRLVEKLRLKGFVERKTCLDDRRQVEVIITQTGLDILSRLDIQMNDWYNNFEKLTEAEAETLNRILDKMRS